MQLWIGLLPLSINPLLAISHSNFHRTRHVCRRQSVRKLSSNSNFISNLLLKIKKSPIWHIKHFPNNLAPETNNKIEPNLSVGETPESIVGTLTHHSTRNHETPDGCSLIRRLCPRMMPQGTHVQPALSTSPLCRPRMPSVAATCKKYYNLPWGGSLKVAV